MQHKVTVLGTSDSHTHYTHELTEPPSNAAQSHSAWDIRLSAKGTWVWILIVLYIVFYTEKDVNLKSFTFLWNLCNSVPYSGWIALYSAVFSKKPCQLKIFTSKFFHTINLRSSYSFFVISDCSTSVTISSSNSF